MSYIKVIDGGKIFRTGVDKNGQQLLSGHRRLLSVIAESKH